MIWFAPDWQPRFAGAGLASFDDFWALDQNWFEPPNRRRGGWSGVSRHALVAGDETFPVFVKRQQGHGCRSWRHPISGEPTFAREFRNLRQWQALGVAVSQPLFYAERGRGADATAILVIAALESCESLESMANRWGSLDFGLRREMMSALANSLRTSSEARWQHGCLYPKHIFVCSEPGVSQPGARSQIVFIDLEKSRRVLSRSAALFRDLDTLNRHFGVATRTERFRFLKLCLPDGYDRFQVRKVWQALARRQLVKKLRRKSS